MTAWIGLLPLARVLHGVGQRRLAGLSVLLFVGVILFPLGGGLLFLAGLGSVAIAPGWYGPRRPAPALIRRVRLSKASVPSLRCSAPASREVCPSGGSPENGADGIGNDDVLASLDSYNARCWSGTGQDRVLVELRVGDWWDPKDGERRHDPRPHPP